MLSEDTIKVIFFLSDKPRKDALFANDVDIVQFAHNIEAVARIHAKREEHERCVEIVSHMNPDVAKGLDSQKPQ